MTEQYANRVQMHAAFESTFGTPPGSGYVTLPYISTNLGRERELLEDDRAGQGLEQVKPVQGDIEGSGRQVVVPMDVRNIGYWMRLVMGSPSTTGAGPYDHTFNSAATNIDDSMSIEMAHLDAGEYFMNKGVLGKSLRFQYGQRGLADLVVGLIQRDEGEDTSSGAGTPTTETFTRLLQRHGTIQADASALGKVMGLNFTYDNGAAAAMYAGDGGLIGGATYGERTLRGTATIRFHDGTWIDKARALTSVSLDMTYTIDASNKLVLDLPEVYLGEPGKPVQGKDAIDVDFPIWAAPNSGAGYAFQAVLTNDVASY